MDERVRRFSDVEISYTENTVDFADFGPVIDELAEDFLTVRLSRNWAGPMATPLFGDVAIVFVIGAAAGAFLSELGKDVYRGLRAGVFALYQSAKSWANGRGYAPLAIEAHSASADSGRVFHFQFPRELDSSEFEAALLSVPAALEAHAKREGRLFGFVFDKGVGWTLIDEV